MKRQCTPPPLAIGVMSLAAVILAGCSSSQPAALPAATGAVAPKVNRLVIAAVPPANETFETRHLNTRDNWQMGVIYERLFANDPFDGKRNPRLLSGWNLEPDGLTFRFKLRDGVRFHYGQGLLTSKDVVTSFNEQMKVDSLKSAATTLRASVKAVTASGDHEFLMLLSRPAAEVLFSIGQVDIFSHTHFIAHGPATYQSFLAGTGPYLLESRGQGSYIRFQRAPYDHWRVKPDLPEIEIRFMKEPSTRLAALVTGEAHLADIPQDLQKEGLTHGGLKVISSLASEQRVWLELNGPVYKDPANPSAGLTHADSPLADARVRRALSKATDRDKLNAAFLGGKGTPMVMTHFTPSLLGWNPDWEKRFADEYGYDPAKARALLAEAGYGPSTPAKITITVTDVEGLSTGRDMAEAVAAMWKVAGIDARLETVERAQLTALSRAGKLDSHAAVRASGTDQFNAMNNFTDGFRADRTAGVSILAADTALKQAINTLDEKKQDEYMRVAGGAWYDQHHSVPLYWLPQEVMANSAIIGEYPFPGNVTGIWTHLEYIKAAR